MIIKRTIIGIKALKIRDRRLIFPYILTQITCPSFILKSIKFLRKKYTLNQIINWGYNDNLTQLMTESFELISITESPRFQFIQACILLE